MKRDHESNPEAWEKDPVWDLLRQSPCVEARPSFADNVVRAARLEPAPQAWWKRFALPIAVGGLSTAASAVIAIVLIVQQPAVESSIVETTPADSPLAALDEALRTEALLVAADHPADFTDAELVSLIAY
ncbi:hypothetical protein ACFQY0_08610 [Haloferula chungangensis]|uniref:Uncharacterized protein n=1 Tax=Haloferula chungangensis TaxID=1048331 RepID=A0ABW2L6R1_9BACT